MSTVVSAFCFAYVKSLAIVAGFPEGHIACTEGREVDWDRLKAKVDSGADFVITQLFFDNADFYAFRDYLRERGMSQPIVAGIIPILSANNC